VAEISVTKCENVLSTLSCNRNTKYKKGGKVRNKTNLKTRRNKLINKDIENKEISKVAHVVN
jgi:hypothetical protein